MTAGYLNRALVAAMPLVPKPLVWRFSRRYIAGTGLTEAFATVRELNAAHCSATIDVLGANLDGVQFYADGEPFSAGGASADDFDAFGDDDDDEF